MANISRAAYYHLHSTGCICSYLNHEHMKQLVHALVISCIDCCNSFLNGLSATLIGKLQRVQNSCVRAIMIRSKRDHVTPMLLELHWLPVKCSITFKTLLLTFKCLHGLAPLYLSALLSLLPDSSDKLLLKQPTSHTKIREQAFSWSAPRAWNELTITMSQ